MPPPPAAAGGAPPRLTAPALRGGGERKPQPDPAVLDNHFNKIIADEEAEQRRLVEEARDREDQRMREMEQRAADDNAGADLAGNNTSD